MITTQGHVTSVRRSPLKHDHNHSFTSSIRGTKGNPAEREFRDKDASAGEIKAVYPSCESLPDYNYQNEVMDEKNNWN